MTWQLVEQQGQTWQLSGSLDLYNSHHLYQRLKNSASLPKNLNLIGLEYCDSAGLACLVFFKQTAKQQGQTLQYLHPSNQLQQLTQLYDLENIIF